MDRNTNLSRYISLHPDDASILDNLAASTHRTRSEIVAEALRAHYEVMRKAYQARTAPLLKSGKEGNGG